MCNFGKYITCLIVFAAAIAICPVAQAQQATAQPAVQNAPPVPPTAKDLAFLIGTWKTQIQIGVTDISPQPISASGNIEYKLFGQAIEARNVSESPRGHFADIELIVYDWSTHNYNIVVVDTNGRLSQRLLKQTDGSWVVEYTGKRNDKNFAVRGTYKVVSANELSYTSEVNIEGTGFKPFGKLTLTRVGAN